MVQYYGLTTIAILALSALAQASNAKRYMGKRDSDREYYTINIPDKSITTAEYVAKRLDVRYEGSVGELDSWYMLSSQKSTIHKRSDEDRVLATFAQIKQSSNMKRDLDAIHFDKVAVIDKQVLKKRTRRAPVFEDDELSNAQRSLGIKDPWFNQQWHLINTENPGNDINVTGVWKQGITGKGVTVAILDDGLDYKSKDLKDNFFAEGSYDFNDHEDLPTPKLWDDSHGTRCAGQIAAVKNDVCGVGIAYECKVAGVRILSGDLTDADEAIALNYEYQKNQIFSCSWGPPDNGRTMEAPNGILSEAFSNGIKNGRQGKGSIYVFATGNGAVSGDNCNFDGYTNSIYTITVGAIDYMNEHPPYSESCSAQLVVTYSSGNGQYIHTTDVGESACSDRHGGTSAAAPNAAGVFALVLQIRPDLTWRDLQYLALQTAEPITLNDNDWVILPSNRLYNHKFGYGKLDAYKLIEAAKSYKLLNEQTHLILPSPVKKRIIPDSTGLKTRKALKNIVSVTAEMINQAGFKRLEHVTATVNIEHQRRGNIVIDLISPSNIKSELATKRNLDDANTGIQNWKFMSVKHWDENPVGNWTLNIYDVDHPESTGYMLNWTLTLFGEMDKNFVGTPIHSSTDVVHEDEHDEIEHTTTTTTAATTHSDNTPPRPTRKVSTTTAIATIHSTTTIATIEMENAIETTKATTTIATTHKDTIAPTTSGNENIATDKPTTEDIEVETETTGKDTSKEKTLTIVYSVVGSVAILAVASAVFFYKRNGWKLPAVTASERPGGYEFDVLQPLTELDEDELSESDEDEQEHDRLTRT